MQLFHFAHHDAMVLSQLFQEEMHTRQNKLSHCLSSLLMEGLKYYNNTHLIRPHTKLFMTFQDYNFDIPAICLLANLRLRCAWQLHVLGG